MKRTGQVRYGSQGGEGCDEKRTFCEVCRSGEAAAARTVFERHGVVR
jgi:hypothetical protein